MLTRDRDGGRVQVDKQGAPLLSYRLSDFDRATMLTGVRGAAEIHAAYPLPLGRAISAVQAAPNQRQGHVGRLDTRYQN